MSGLAGLLGVARYERIMLMRTMRYRMLGGIGIGIPIFVGIVLAIAEARGAETGTVFGVGAFVPFYIYSFLQTVVVAFVAGDFRAADERAQVYEVIAVRPLSTTQLVVGKYLGILQGLVALSLTVMTITVAVQAAKLSVLGTPFRLEPYLGYLLLMNLPGLVYMTALTFCLGAILRNRTAAALVALAYAIGTIFFLGERYGDIFDFGGFYAPLFYSDLLGFGDLGRVVELRLFYLAAAVVLLGMAVERYPRLAQAGVWRWTGRAVATAALGACIAMFLGMRRDDAAALAERTDFLRAHVTRAADSPGSIVHYDLDIRLLEEGVPLAVDATLRVRNSGQEPLEAAIVGLNPGLEILEAGDDVGRALHVERDGSVAVVVLAAPLAVGDETTIRLSYAGDIDRNGFDLLRTAPRRDRSDGPLRMPQLTAWIRPHSVFLPARSGWYPASGVDYGHDVPPMPSFATGTLRITAPEGLQVVTQGQPVDATGQGSGRTTAIFRVDEPVPSLTLNGGPYDVYETTIGDVEMALYVHPDHAFAIRFFDDASEEIQKALGQLLAAIVRETGLPYPYRRLNIVEVPLVVQWYYEGWREVGGLTAPGVLMVEEDVLTGQDLAERLSREERNADGDFDVVSAKRDVLVSAIFRQLLSPESERYGIFRSPLVQLWSYDRAFVGEESTLLERAMPVYMQQDVGTDVRAMMFQSEGRRARSPREARGGASAAMIAAAEEATGPVQGRSNSDWNAVLGAMQRETFASMNPDADPELYRAVLDAKGVSIFRTMKAVVGADAFADAVRGFAESSRHAGVDFDSFEAAVTPIGSSRGAGTGRESGDGSVTDTFEPNLQRLVRSWLDGTAVPGYTITRATARKLEDARGAVIHQVLVRIRNGEAGVGFVQVNAVGFRDEVSQGVQIEGGGEVEVALLIADRPTRVTVDTFFAKNRRSLVAPLRVGDLVERDRPESYVRRVDTEESPLTEIIVDNEDEGFSMPTRRVRRYLRPAVEGGNWWVRATLFAYGRYENNYRMKNGRDGAEPAVWSARMPRTGPYDIAYYFLPESTAWARSGVWRLARRFEITIHYGDEVRRVSLDTAELTAGWNLLGRYEFEAGEEVRVELSDRASGRLYADAIRWRLADSDVVYEEDITPWQTAPRSRSGGRSGR